jgi:hypothetical protein
MIKRVCDICGTKLAGKKGHGFVINNGRTLVCGDYRRHERLKHKRKFNYEPEPKITYSEDSVDTESSFVL